MVIERKAGRERKEAEEAGRGKERGAERDAVSHLPLDQTIHHNYHLLYVLLLAADSMSHCY